MFFNSLTTKKTKLNKLLNKITLKKLKKKPSFIPGTTKIDGIKFHYHDGLSFYETYKEIFIRGIYDFNTTNLKPIIIDGGANMGLSVLFFAKKYPKATIYAFEPEEKIFNILQKNTIAFNLKNVVLHQKALWINNNDLTFYTDGGMGGSVTNVYQNQTPTIVKTEILRDFLNQPIDFLKLDIEGAEFEVVSHCEDLLKNISNVFIEYHSYVKKEQQLGEMLNKLKSNKFTYHLTQSFSRGKPFVDTLTVCDNMDMAINIYGYRK